MHACVSKHYYLLFYFSARSTVGRRRDERKSPFDNTLIGSLTFTWYGRKGLRMAFFISLLSVSFFLFTRLSLILLGLASMPNYGLASPLVLFFSSTSGFLMWLLLFCLPFSCLPGMNVSRSGRFCLRFSSSRRKRKRHGSTAKRQPTAAKSLQAASKGTMSSCCSLAHGETSNTGPGSVLSICTAGMTVFRFPYFFFLFPWNLEKSTLFATHKHRRVASVVVFPHQSIFPQTLVCVVLAPCLVSSLGEFDVVPSAAV